MLPSNGSMALEGDLQTMAVREVLGWLAARKATGQLTLSRAMVVRRFHLRKGQVLMASSSEEETLIGRLLVEQGLVTETQLGKVLGQRGRSRARLVGPERSEGTRLRQQPIIGKALTEAGLIDEPTLARVLADKCERLLQDTLHWTEGSFHFQVGSQPRRQAGVASPLDLAALLARTSAAGRAAEVAITDDDVIEAVPLGVERRRATAWRARLGAAMVVTDDDDPPAAA